MACRPMIIPIFIPHYACPYRCVFCNKNNISGFQKSADLEMIDQAFQTYFRKLDPFRSGRVRQVAFCGGSFTGLPQIRQLYLLNQIQPWIKREQIDSIRVSTHPLWIDEGRLEFIHKFNVSTIELGIQSTNQTVLKQSGRECTWGAIRDAVNLIHKRKFELGFN